MRHVLTNSAFYLINLSFVSPICRAPVSEPILVEEKGVLVFLLYTDLGGFRKRHVTKVGHSHCPGEAIVVFSSWRTFLMTKHQKEVKKHGYFHVSAWLGILGQILLAFGFKDMPWNLKITSKIVRGLPPQRYVSISRGDEKTWEKLEHEDIPGVVKQGENLSHIPL